GPGGGGQCGPPGGQGRGGQPGRLRAGLRAAVAPLAAPRAAVLLAPVLRALAAGFFFWAEAAPSGAVAALREPVFTDCIPLAANWLAMSVAVLNASLARPVAMFLVVSMAVCLAASFIALAAICWNWLVSAPHHCIGSTIAFSAVAGLVCALPADLPRARAVAGLAASAPALSAASLVRPVARAAAPATASAAPLTVSAAFCTPLITVSGVLRSEG